MNCGYLGKCGGIYANNMLARTTIATKHKSVATKLPALMANCGHNDEKEGMDGLILEKLKADDNQVRQ